MKSQYFEEKKNHESKVISDKIIVIRRNFEEDASLTMLYHQSPSDYNFHEFFLIRSFGWFNFIVA